MSETHLGTAITRGFVSASRAMTKCLNIAGMATKWRGVLLILPS
jgi:hypothetical protein